jgi:hypothetical protein
VSIITNTQAIISQKLNAKAAFFLFPMLFSIYLFYTRK